MEYEIWIQGYAFFPGEKSNARLLGKMEAGSFQEACDKFFVGPEHEYQWFNNETKNYYNKENMTYWACRLFDNEKDARKIFG